MPQEQNSNLTDKEKQRDKRLQKNYRWSLNRRNRLAADQNNCCAICGRPESPAMPLNVDHEHFKITARRRHELDILWQNEARWISHTQLRGQMYEAWGKTKKEAIENLRDFVLPLSVRGLLCPGRNGKAGHGCCNRLLGRVDNIEWLEKALAYLKNPPAYKIPCEIKA